MVNSLLLHYSYTCSFVSKNFLNNSENLEQRACHNLNSLDPRQRKKTQSKLNKAAIKIHKIAEEETTTQPMYIEQNSCAAGEAQIEQQKDVYGKQEIPHLGKSNRFLAESPDSSMVLGKSSMNVRHGRSYVHLENNENYYIEFNGNPHPGMFKDYRKDKSYNLHRHGSKRVLRASDKFMQSHKSLKKRRRRKKRPDFDLSFGNSASIKPSRSKGFLSNLSRRRKDNSGKRANYSSTFINNF